MTDRAAPGDSREMEVPGLAWETLPQVSSVSSTLDFPSTALENQSCLQKDTSRKTCNGLAATTLRTHHHPAIPMTNMPSAGVAIQITG